MTVNWTKDDYAKKIYNPDYKYHWSSVGNTVTDYGDFARFWSEKNVKLIANRDRSIQVFGDPFKTEFPVKNIAHFDLTPYSSINFSGTRNFGVHRQLLPAFRRVFEKWASWGEYPLYCIGSSYDPRYASPSDPCPILTARAARIGQPLYTWFSANFSRLLKIPGLEDLDEERLKWLPRLLYHYDNTNSSGTLGNLSNHSFGAAIDINPRTNGLGSSTWDMPVQLVKFFREEGFYWGGYYKSGLDSMHFEYKIDRLPPSLPIVFGPFSGSFGEPPAQSYLSNETGDGGFFPVGSNSNLHGGIHLRPAGNSKSVRATLPGYIVAARLLSPDMFKEDLLPYAFCAGHLGLVLIRHCGYKLDEAGKPTGDPVSWYSLYLHLKPPSYDLSANDPWNNVPWFKTLLLSKFGAAVVLDPQSDAFEKNVWLAEDPLQNTSEIKGHLFGCEQNKELGNPLKLKVISDGKRLLVPKPAPEDLSEAVQSLKSGALITFHRPFLLVNPNDSIGITGDGNAFDKVAGMAGDMLKNSGAKPGFLHFEWLSPPGDNGLQALPGLLGLSNNEMPVIEEATDRVDNFFDNDELKDILRPLLPDNERTPFETVLKNEPYISELIDFFQKEASFSSSEQNDITVTKPTAPVNDCKKTYSLKLNFQSTDLPPPAQGETYTIIFEFITRIAGGEKIISEGTYQVTDHTFGNPLIIQVPAETHLIRVKSSSFHIEPIVIDDSRIKEISLNFFKDLTSRRWRGCLLKHLNEWTVESLGALVKTLKDKQLIPESLQSDTLKPMAWYNRVHDDSDPFSENPILGAEGGEFSLFSSNADGVPDNEKPYLLPSDTPLVNMHPITGNWLIALLQLHRKFDISTNFDFRQPQDSKEIWWWSIFTMAPARGFGERLNLVAIAKGFPNQGTAVMTLEKGNRSLQYEALFVDGLARQSVELLLWDTWDFKVDGADGQPAMDGFLHQISLPQPVVLGPMRLSRDTRSGCINIRAFFSSRCPEILSTFLNINTLESSGTALYSGYAIPVQGRKRKNYDCKFDDTDTYIEIASSKKISTVIIKTVLSKAAKTGGATKLALSLLWVLESLYEIWKNKYPYGAALNLTTITPDSCGANSFLQKK